MMILLKSVKTEIPRAKEVINNGYKEKEGVHNYRRAGSR